MAATGDAASVSFLASHLHLLGFDTADANRGTFQAILELVDNASDACHGVPGSGVLVQVRQAGLSAVQVTVTDTGRGMAVEEAASLSSSVFLSSKRDVGNRIGTYGVGLKGVVLFSLMGSGGTEPSRRPPPSPRTCGAFGELLVASVAQNGGSAVRLRVVASRPEGAATGVSLSVTSSSSAASIGASSRTVVSVLLPTRGLSGLILLVSRYCAARSLVARSHVTEVQVFDEAGELLFSSRLDRTTGLDASDGCMPLDVAAVAQALRVSDIEVCSSRAAVIASAPAAAGGIAPPASAPAHTASGPLSLGPAVPVDASAAGAVRVHAAVVLQFVTRQAGVPAGHRLAADPPARASSVGPRVRTSLFRAVNGAPLRGAAAECCIARTIRAGSWAPWGLGPAGPSAPVKQADPDAFEAPIVELEPVSVSPAAPSTAEAAVASFSSEGPRELELPPGAHSFQRRVDSHLAAIRILVHVSGPIGVAAPGRPGLDRTGTLRFHSFRKRSLVPHPRLSRRVRDAVGGAMAVAAARFPALLRSAAHRSESNIFGGLLPSLAASIGGIAARMGPRNLAAVARALRLDADEATLRDVKEELADRVARAAETTVQEAGAARRSDAPPPKRSATAELAAAWGAKSL
ncbi:hypothetical protein FNF31_02951 [Cafeteria roenbergensis]|uniref:Histidine kinase/HSP90-like ATPase domain-containing protein n=1 Tax=Cafeteria roenbergensis TaxID=33653 RepID=A0A5A8DD44_CAFRO|nr:hypothetical protein FNF31_02951 [Cafeteria roenbergensis]KAA0164510.1 hypothetical protein FNF28_03851 [Cafeteria roenbergensis]